MAALLHKKRLQMAGERLVQQNACWWEIEGTKSNHHGIWEDTCKQSIINICQDPTRRRCVYSLEAEWTVHLLLLLHLEKFRWLHLYHRFSRTRHKSRPPHTNHDKGGDNAYFHIWESSYKVCHILDDCTAHHTVYRTYNGHTSTRICDCTARTPPHTGVCTWRGHNGFRTARNMTDRTLDMALCKDENIPAHYHTSIRTVCAPKPFDTRHTFQSTGDHIPKWPHRGLGNLPEWLSKQWWLHVHMANPFSWRTLGIFWYKVDRNDSDNGESMQVEFYRTVLCIALCSSPCHMALFACVHRMAAFFPQIQNRLFHIFGNNA